MVEKKINGVNLQSYDFVVYQRIDREERENHRFTASKWKEFKNNLVDYMKKRGEPSKVLMLNGNEPIAVINRYGVELDEMRYIKEVRRLFDWDMIIMCDGMTFNKCVLYTEEDVKWLWRNGYNAFDAL